jgi:hypothetical protein
MLRMRTELSDGTITIRVYEPDIVLAVLEARRAGGPALSGFRSTKRLVIMGKCRTRPSFVEPEDDARRQNSYRGAWLNGFLARRGSR